MVDNVFFTQSMLRRTMFRSATANYDELLKSGAGRLLRCKEEAQSAVRAVLQSRFGSAPGIQALTQITNLRQLDDLLRLAATVENLEAFQTALTALF